MDGDPPTTEELLAVESRRERSEIEHAEDAATGAEETAARRRAEKAGYLKEKLREQADAQS